MSLFKSSKSGVKTRSGSRLTWSSFWKKNTGTVRLHKRHIFSSIGSKSSSSFSSFLVCTRFFFFLLFSACFGFSSSSLSSVFGKSLLFLNNSVMKFGSGSYDVEPFRLYFVWFFDLSIASVLTEASVGSSALLCFLHF